jgi:hypothetical protein
MFLNIKANNFICFYKTVLNSQTIDIVNNEFNINLSSIDEITIKKCSEKTYRNNEILELKYQIEFDKFVEEGILNYFILFFKNNQDKEFKRINKIIKIIKNNIYKEYKMAKNHNGDIRNPNKGTKGTNKTYDKNQGNRGKQKNPNQKKGS